MKKEKLFILLLITYTFSMCTKKENNKSKLRLNFSKPNINKASKVKPYRTPASTKSINIENKIKKNDKVKIKEKENNLKKNSKIIKKAKSNLRKTKTSKLKIKEKFLEKDLKKQKTKKTNKNKVFKTKKNINFDLIKSFKTDISLFFTSFDVVDLSNNSPGSISSKTNLDIRLTWVQDWSKDNSLSSNVFVNYKKYYFLGSTGLESDNIDIFKFGMGFNYNIIKNFDLEFESFYGQDIFFKSFKFDIANQYGFDLKLDYQFYTYNSYNLGFTTGVGTRINNKVDNTYNAKNSFKYGASVYVSQGGLKAEFSYQNIDKDTQYFSQSQSNFIFKVSKTWKI